MLHNFNSSIPYPCFKDFKYKKNINQLTELKINLIKMFLIDKRLAYNLKYILKIKYLSLYGKSINRYKSLCILSGKSRFMFKYFNLNRSMLKFHLSFGLISGFKHK